MGEELTPREPSAKKPVRIFRTAQQAINAVREDNAVGVWQDLFPDELSPKYIIFFDPETDNEFGQVVEELRNVPEEEMEERERLSSRLSTLVSGDEGLGILEEPRKIYKEGAWTVDPNKLLEDEKLQRQREIESAIAHDEAQRERLLQRKANPIDQSVGKEIANPEHVQQITRWLKLAGSWGSGDPIEKYAEYAPDGMSKADLRATFLSMRSLGTPSQDYDTRGYYMTALADKILREEFDKRFPNGASPEEEQKYWDEEAVIELQRPQTGKYDGFRHFGTYWTRGTLVLRGDFRRDTDIGYGMQGGKIVVLGDMGPSAGTFMTGGILEVLGHAQDYGYGKKGGEIIAYDENIDYEGTKPKPEPTESEIAIRDEYGKLSTQDLARSWLEYSGAKLAEKIRDAQRTLDSAIKQRPPKPPGPTPSWVEPGSMDASDWENERLAYDQWPEDHEEYIEYWENEVLKLNDELEGIRSDIELVNTGSSALIDRYAMLEIERIVRADESRRRRESQDEEFKREDEQSKGEKEMDGASDVENDLKQIANLLREGVIPRSKKGTRGWLASSTGTILGFYDGSELSSRTPSVRVDIGALRDGGRRVVVRDWRNAQSLEEKHPYNNRGKARKGKFYSADVKGDKVSYYRAGDVIDDSEEFPREEILATQEGFGQAQMYALRDIIKEAATDLMDLADQSQR